MQVQKILSIMRRYVDGLWVVNASFRKSCPSSFFNFSPLVSLVHSFSILNQESQQSRQQSQDAHARGAGGAGHRRGRCRGATTRRRAGGRDSRARHVDDIATGGLTVGAHDGVDFTRGVAGHEQGSRGIPREAGGTEALAGTRGVVVVGEHVHGGGGAGAGGDGRAFGELDDAQLVAHGIRAVPAAVEGDPSGGAGGVEENVEGSHVGLERQARGLSVDGAAHGVVVGAVDGVDGELLADGARVVRDDGWIPRCEALRVAEVTALVGRVGPVEVAEEIHLFGGIVLVDVFALWRGEMDMLVS